MFASDGVLPGDGRVVAAEEKEAELSVAAGSNLALACRRTLTSDGETIQTVY